MPFKTQYGSHYHLVEGCHGATIPCSTEGLEPCSDCCGGGPSGGGGAGLGAIAGAGALDVSAMTGDGGQVPPFPGVPDIPPAMGFEIDENGEIVRGERSLAETLGDAGTATSLGADARASGGASMTDEELTEFTDELIRVLWDTGYEGYFRGQALPDNEFVDELAAALSSDQSVIDELYPNDIREGIEQGVRRDPSLLDELRDITDSPVPKTEREQAAEARRARILAAEDRMDEIVMGYADHSGPGGGWDVPPSDIVSTQIDMFLDNGRTKEQVNALRQAKTMESRRYVLARQLEELGAAPWAAETSERYSGMVRDALQMLVVSEHAQMGDRLPVTTNPTYDEANGRRYEIVPADSYVDILQIDGAEEVNAEKSARILVRAGVPGERIPVWTANGDCEADEVVSEGRLVVTRCDDDGNPVIDEHGHANTWTMGRGTFEKKYDSEHVSENGVAKPRGGRQRFIRVDRDIAIMVPWGEDGALIPQRINAGGWLNITDSNDIYGIAEGEFADTYATV